MNILDVRDVRHWYPGATSGDPVLQDVNLSLDQGGIVAVVGESGCGKSTLGKLVAGLAQPTQGEISFDGQPVTSLSGRELKSYRRSVQLVQQDPYGSLNPGLTISDALGAALLHHKMASRKTIKEHLLRLLSEVGLDATQDFLNRYPHQLSGGQRQRVAIARAMSLEPRLVVADEATSMLDVSMRVAILDLLLSLRTKRQLSYLFISHDFGVVRYFAQGGRIIVMFYGVIVEAGPAEQVITDPKHPYTYLLLDAIPVPDPVLARARRANSDSDRVTGEPARSGCVFSNRCPFAEDQCRTTKPPLAEIATGHQTACWFPERIPTLARIERGEYTDAQRSGEGDDVVGAGHADHGAPDPLGRSHAR